MCKRKIGFTFKSFRKKDRIFPDPPRAYTPIHISEPQYRSVTFTIKLSPTPSTKNGQSVVLLIKPYIVTNTLKKHLAELEEGTQLYENFLENVIGACDINIKLIINALKNDTVNQVENMKTEINLYKSIHKLNEDIENTEKKIIELSMAIDAGPDHSKTKEEKRKLKILEESLDKYRKYDTEITRQKGIGIQIASDIKTRIKKSLRQIEDLKTFYREIFVTCCSNTKKKSATIPSEFEFDKEKEEKKLIETVVDAEIKAGMNRYGMIITDKWVFDESLPEGDE